MNLNIFQRKKSAVFTKYSALQLMMEPSWSKRDYVSFAEEGYIKNVIAFRAIIALFTIIRTDRNMLLACYSHKHISYRIRTIIRKAII